MLHVSELFDQLDVTLESSKIVKLALTWVASESLSEMARPNAAMLYVYNMSLFLVA